MLQEVGPCPAGDMALPHWYSGRPALPMTHTAGACGVVACSVALPSKEGSVLHPVPWCLGKCQWVSVGGGGTWLVGGPVGKRSLLGQLLSLEQEQGNGLNNC